MVQKSQIVRIVDILVLNLYSVLYSWQTCYYCVAGDIIIGTIKGVKKMGIGSVMFKKGY